MKPIEAQKDLPIEMLRHATANKLNPNSGTLDYEVGRHAETAEPYLRISTNSSGGHFSPEWLPITAISACFGDNIQSDTAFSSRVLRGVFQHGKSTNNASFLAAVLRQEGLLVAHEKNKFQHCIQIPPSNWQAHLLGEDSNKKPTLARKKS